MKNITRVLAVLTLSLFFLAGCASQLYHNYIMSGQVVSTKGSELVVCVADTTNLQKNTVFSVYRVVYDETVTVEGESGYAREYIGKVRLGNTKDKHFANATILSGKIQPSDIIEFTPK
ncbi:hypothetical protein I6E78_11655 [Pseudoalteromonas sp. NZS127]|uniref:hypothetical protein n=1 Tax=Pseudoalteromonas TaxID=53246 RepID=UPI000C8D6BE5|nr:hypothetical protein [Pseudoalteromonas sp. NZS127]MAD77080.1 hypothetical protein [Rheinheimera sp.]MBH0072626.1 hypothetical protein [Pseudoalteromonas sp. NZS127]|tara:strand:- start:12417 stop:12770 length:354 start_codon:yes stop_codon:yes gene_type:complete